MDALLLVEDDQDVMDVTAFLLEDAGYEVLRADGVEQALAACEERPDLAVVFTHVNLRQAMNGIELARELRARGCRAAVVVTSGDLAWADTPLDASMRFLAKPYDRRTLIDTVAASRGAPSP